MTYNEPMSQGGGGNLPAQRQESGIPEELQRPRGMMAKGLSPHLAELGKIKIGRKGELKKSRYGKEYRESVSLDHFIVTTLHRGRDDNFVPNTPLMDRIKATAGQPGGAILDRNGNLVGLPIRLLFNDPTLNFPTKYAAYSGRSPWCTGNGETAVRNGEERPCPCEHFTSPKPPNDLKCKFNGVLSCILEQSDMVGGTYRFFTTGRNSCESMLGSMASIQLMAGGRLAGLPLTLIVHPKATLTPDGTPTTIQVVSVVFRGTMEDLHNLTLERAKSEALFHRDIRKIESMAERLIAFDDDESDDIAAEYYPESYDSSEPSASASTTQEASSPASAQRNAKPNGNNGRTAAAPPESKPHPSNGNGGLNIRSMAEISGGAATAPAEEPADDAEPVDVQPEAVPDPAAEDRMLTKSRSGWEVGMVAIYPFGNGIGERRVRVNEIISADEVRIEIAEPTVHDGKEWMGKAANKPEGELRHIPNGHSDAPEAAPLIIEDFNRLKAPGFGELMRADDTADRLAASEEAAIQEFFAKADRLFDRAEMPDWVREQVEEMFPAQAAGPEESDQGNEPEGDGQSAEHADASGTAFTGAPDDRIGDDPEHKALRKIHAAVTEKGFDREEVKTFMRGWSIHPKGESPRKPFDVESTKDIRIADVKFWNGMLDDFETYHKVVNVYLPAREELTPGFTKYVMETLGGSHRGGWQNPVDIDAIGGWFRLTMAQIDRVNKNLEGWNEYYKADLRKAAAEAPTEQPADSGDDDPDSDLPGF